jgi:hypothetical protein
MQLVSKMSIYSYVEIKTRLRKHHEITAVEVRYSYAVLSSQSRQPVAGRHMCVCVLFMHF